MTEVEDIELGTFFGAVGPRKVGQVTKSMRLGSLDLLVVGFGWLRLFVEIEGLEQELRYGTD